MKSSAGGFTHVLDETTTNKRSSAAPVDRFIMIMRTRRWEGRSRGRTLFFLLSSPRRRVLVALRVSPVSGYIAVSDSCACASVCGDGRWTDAELERIGCVGGGRKAMVGNLLIRSHTRAPDPIDRVRIHSSTSYTCGSMDESMNRGV